MLTIGVLNLKGGVGKSTISAHLAVQAVLDPRYNIVAIVDCDPQSSAKQWHTIGKRKEPDVMVNESTPGHAAEKLYNAGYEVCIFDGAPAFITTLEDTISASNLVIVPFRSSNVDVESTSQTVALCRNYQTPYLLVCNEARTARDSQATAMIEKLTSIDEPVYPKPIQHRAVYSEAYNAGRSVADYRGKKWQPAINEIKDLYDYVIDLAIARSADHGR